MSRQRIEITGIRVPYEPTADCDAEAIRRARNLLRRTAGCSAENVRLAKKSIDARRGITFVYTVSAEIEAGEKQLRKLTEDGGVRLCPAPSLELPVGERPMRHRPVIVGFGPAGMFAGLVLAEAGFRPLILERGAAVEERAEAVERFIRDGVLDPDSNVQFGAGGAGTFSDGKLTTRIGDPLIACGSCRPSMSWARRRIFYTKQSPTSGRTFCAEW